MSPAANVRAREVLKRLPTGPVKGAEVGVWRGHMSAALLQRPDLELYMVDDWIGNEEFASLGYGPDDQMANKAMAVEQTSFAAVRRHVVHNTSVVAAEGCEDGSLDFVFIDAEHSYDSVKSDISAWLPKLKPGGLLCGHDYANGEYPFGAEVKRAVDEAVEMNEWRLEIGYQYCWFVRLP